MVPKWDMLDVAMVWQSFAVVRRFCVFEARQFC